MIRFSIGILFYLIIFQVCAQSPLADFNVTAAVCTNETLELSNQSSGAVGFEWDFCLNDIKNLKKTVNILPISGLSWGSSYKLVNNNGQWYGFAISFNNSKLYRLDFGNNPSNIPVVNDMGNLSGQLADPFGIEIVFSQGEWFGFIGSYDISFGVVMMAFGSSLSNAPTVSNLGNFNVATRYMDLRAVAQGADNFLVLNAGDPRSLVIVNFKNSFHNTPQPQDIFNTGSFSGINSLFGFDIVNVNGNWIALITNYSTNEIFKLSFGSNIQSVPIVENSYTFSGVTSPLRIKILQEGSGFYAVVSVQSQPFVTIDFGDLSSSATPQFINQPPLPVLYGFDALRWQGKSIVQGLSDADNNLQYALFENVCSATSEFSTASNPQGLNYKSGGAEQIELVAIASSGERSITGKSLIVSSSTSPDISFTTNGFVCAGSAVSFNAVNSSGDILTYAWDYGDATTGSGSTSQHAYLVGQYLARLDVVSTNGCKNFSKTNLNIYNSPQANFNLPSASPICTNQNYLFANTTTSDTGSNPSWQWSINGINTATTQDLSYSFTSAIAQSITLVASIPGCSTQSTQSIATVFNGPLVDFTLPAAGCLNAATSFTNATTGSVTGYAWSFGDGNNSLQTNASNAYAATGTYVVTLTASNAAGCQNSATKNLSIYSNPQPDFAIEAPPYSCANYPAQFDNNTQSLTDSNISTWAWSFGDAANGTSNQKNPAYTYTTAANYNVTLQATTNFGCIGSKNLSVAILPSPQAAFTSSPACVNQNTQLMDASSGNITSYQWAVQSTILTGAIPPPYIFKSAGSYTVTLTTTGNNGCKNQVAKNITVPVPPIMDFTFQPPCTNKPVTFQELNPGGSDPSVSWNWNFGSVSATGSPVNQSFTTASGYSVTLSATRKSGCVYSVSKQVNIYDGPIAKFTPSIQAGAAPLAVTFNNASTADSYLWQFGDANNSQSTDFSPQFTYTQLGVFNALLTANNIYGCTDTLSAKIYVVIPRIDLSMKTFSLVDDPSSNSSKAVITLSNLGNIPLTNPEVLIDLGGNVFLKEKISSTVLPGKSIQQTLSLEIVPQSLPYICAEVSMPGDVNIFNDQQCLSLTNNDVVFSPYPNPASSQINFDWISIENEDVMVTVYKSSGQVAFEQNFPSVQPGINQLNTNTSSLSGGLYLIQFTGVKTKKTFRVMISN